MSDQHKITNIAVLVSGGGTNLQAILDAVEDGYIDQGKVSLVLSSNPEAYALERASKHGIPTTVISNQKFPNRFERTQAILDALRHYQVDLVVLAGYLSILEPAVIEQYRGNILNVHPSLIPKFCGPGCYGKRVHQAVLNAKEKFSGATVHFVDEGVDTGTLIFQESVPVNIEDTVDSLAERVLEKEHMLLRKAIRLYCRGELEKGTRSTSSGEENTVANREENKL